MCSTQLLVARVGAPGKYQFGLVLTVVSFPNLKHKEAAMVGKEMGGGGLRRRRGRGGGRRMGEEMAMNNLVVGRAWSWWPCVALAVVAVACVGFLGYTNLDLKEAAEEDHMTASNHAVGPEWHPQLIFSKVKPKWGNSPKSKILVVTKDKARDEKLIEMCKDEKKKMDKMEVRVEAWEGPGNYVKLMIKLKEECFHPTVVVITFDDGTVWEWSHNENEYEVQKGGCVGKSFGKIWVMTTLCQILKLT